MVEYLHRTQPPHASVSLLAAAARLAVKHDAKAVYEGLVEAAEANGDEYG